MINFGDGHDSKYGNHTIESIPENGIGIMVLGFSSIQRITELMEKEKKFFVLRIKNNISLKSFDQGRYLIGKGKQQVEAR